ncbi:hypothetical protein [Caenibius sp. WL]|uniref:hypothetical protein n=1 Tax=Caenibius sp. WL TaxID=2872646 RepID=UPI001C99931A|nr:hypothetical protein [Caenibius sp. WL]QZP06811.1 hypothetical protein K5X80_08725 [Caenibius sp. WL]
MSDFRSSLGRFAASMRDPDPAGKFRAARALWHEMGIIVVFPGDVHGLDKEWTEAFANKHYGRRGTR